VKFFAATALALMALTTTAHGRTALTPCLLAVLPPLCKGQMKEFPL
jgi:hypothetical protein